MPFTVSTKLTEAMLVPCSNPTRIQMFAHSDVVGSLGSLSFTHTHTTRRSSVVWMIVRCLMYVQRCLFSEQSTAGWGAQHSCSGRAGLSTWPGTASVLLVFACYFVLMPDDSVDGNTNWVVVAWTVRAGRRRASRRDVFLFRFLSVLLNSFCPVFSWPGSCSLPDEPELVQVPLYSVGRDCARQGRLLTFMKFLQRSLFVVYEIRNVLWKHVEICDWYDDAEWYLSLFPVDECEVLIGCCDARIRDCGYFQLFAEIVFCVTWLLQCSDVTSM